MIVVVKPGLLSTVQDLGRPGYAHLGVARSGALDPPALIAANRLVGNPDGAAVIETTLTGLTLRAEIATVVAVTGAPALLAIDGVAVPFATANPVPAGAVLEVGSTVSGVRSYVAFAGGVTVAPVLGSRSTDTMSGLGPPPLRAGFVLPLGRSSPPSDPPVDQGLVGVFRSSGHPDSALIDGGVELRIRMGPRQDWFSVTGRDALLAEAYALSVKSNRVGARLSGPTLSRVTAGELPSEGIVLGAVQVPADGQPLVFLADHPTTGGYPVIGVVDTADLPQLAQARPGTPVRFVSWT